MSLNKEVLIDLVIGARPGELSETDRVRPAQFSFGEDSSARSECIGARGGPHRGPRFTPSHHQVCYQRLSSLNQNESRREREKGFFSRRGFDIKRGLMRRETRI